MKRKIMELIVIAKALQGETACMICFDETRADSARDSITSFLIEIGLEREFMFSNKKIMHLGSRGEIIFSY